MHEDLLAVVLDNKAEAFRHVEPLHLARLAIARRGFAGGYRIFPRRWLRCGLAGVGGVAPDDDRGGRGRKDEGEQQAQVECAACQLHAAGEQDAGERIGDGRDNHADDEFGD